ncbi:MAG: 16S rRNA (cytosine(967)-C(5))-methyltransferase RsmB [Desulforhopalus sp.]|nr:16S rRNA (cytosine(967)-C(5))-methyltransferase RsmB [Desulforhopalus sp.]
MPHRQTHSPGPQILQKKPTIPTARFVAAQTLCRLYVDRSPVKPLLQQGIRKYTLPGIERNLAMQLVYGVLRNRQYLDRIIELLSTTPLAKIDPFIHQVLAVGLYQLFFLERIPQSAAVDEMVECCKVQKIPKRLWGFVNGILRQSIRQKEALTVRARFMKDGGPVVNHPEWLFTRWQDHFGREEALRICAANNREPVLVLRTNGEKIGRDDFCLLLTEAGITAQPGSYAPEAVVLPEYQGGIPAIPGFAEGLFQVQDEAAQLATALLGPFRRGGRYLDGCAGLGGKTTHLLQFAADHALDVHAVEPEIYRLEKLRENLIRLGKAPAVHIHAKNLQQFAAEDGQFFDGILIDAPCSGTGVTGRHPDIRWNRRPEDLCRYQEEQLDILHHAAALLAPGGVLVYATCSLEPEENHQLITAFLAGHRSLHLTDCSEHLPEAARRFIVDRCFAPRPDATIDGFFAARMQRR